MGLDPIDVLVLPRIIALVIGLPILAFLGSMAALYGGGLVCWLYAGINPDIFKRQPILRCQDSAWPMKSNTTVSDSSAGAKVSACACSVGAATTEPIAYR
jgi:ABC-type transporter Mla maintaining outer membrane lipid asymmetry permease subunit MlaE